MNNAPFVLHVFDDRFECPNDKNWVLSSVCFAPCEQLHQVNAFAHAYMQLSECRLDVPLTADGAKATSRRQHHHILCGDWGCHVDEFGGGCLTSVLAETVGAPGQRDASHDNFVVNDTVRAQFTQSHDVLQLDLVDGDRACDHNPIAIKLTELMGTPQGSTAKQTASECGVLSPPRNATAEGGEGATS